MIKFFVVSLALTYLIVEGVLSSPPVKGKSHKGVCRISCVTQESTFLMRM